MDPSSSTTSPPPCPITVRRNPHRRARPTPATSAPPKPLFPSLSPHQIPSFPLQEILNINLTQNPNNKKPDSNSDTLKVFLRIKPLVPKRAVVKAEAKNVWPRRVTEKNESRTKINKTKGGICLSINDKNSVTLCPPKGFPEAKRAKTEVFEGFSHVFSADSSQAEVFDKMVKPLVDEFLSGRSGTLVALGPSGSGKTHTVFGSPREPGMVPLALDRIFSEDGMNHNQSSRTFYLSIYEISERGKSERLFDLLQDGGELCFQQSAIRGLQEVHISDVQQAECLIARAILKRATAMTGSNSQSSRSQCVINIRTNKINEKADVELDCAVLTIVDLAGAERERKTGNQGARLLESNFINTTSMVFGLCLRSLLEHQKNPKRPLQKHFQSSLLTRILREYLEGKKRMALILTVKSGEEDYVDSSLLLRQASPYTKIKFDNAEEPVNLLCTKRHKQTMPRIEPSKRMKFSPGELVNDDGNGVGDQLHEEEGQKAKKIAPQLPVVHAESTIGLGTSECVYHGKRSTGIAKQERNYMIMQNFAKAFWNVLKQYKANLEVAENKILNLTESLAYEKARSSELEIELKDLKGTLSYGKISSDKEDIFVADKHVEKVGYQGQSYQVAENKIQNLTDSLVNKKARSSELEIDLDLKGSLPYGEEISSAKEDSMSADKSEEEAEYDGQSGKVAENQIDHLREVLADEGATRSELEVNRSCWKEISPVKEDSFSVNRNGEQVGSQQTDNVPDSNSCSASSLAVVNSKSQGQGHQSTDQECIEFLGDVDCTVASTELTDVENVDTQFNDSGNQKDIVSFPEQLTITKEHSCHLAESNQILFAECKVTSDSPLEENRKTLMSSPEPLTIIKETSPKPLTIAKENICHSAENNCKVTSDSPIVENRKTLMSSHEPLRIIKETSSKPLTITKENICHSAENNCKVTSDSPLVENRKTLMSSPEPLTIIKETSPKPHTITKENICHSAENNQMHSEEYKGRSRWSKNLRKAEAHPDSDVNNRPKIEKKIRPCKPSNVEKPKRRLAPASSILLKDLGGLNFEDENEKPKGIKGDKKSGPNERNTTQGSLSLLRLLNSNLHI